MALGLLINITGFIILGIFFATVVDFISTINAD